MSQPAPAGWPVQPGAGAAKATEPDARAGEDTLVRGAQALGLTLDAQQKDRLLRYAALILKWNKVYNLTALRDPAAVLTHHLLDSLAIIAPLALLARMPRMAPTTASTADTLQLLDVGSGAGLPGIVIAIMRSSVQVDCVDAVAKKAAFIRQAAAELQLPNLGSIHARIETEKGRYPVVCSRAFASLADFTACSAHLLAPGGVWLAMKGKVPTREIAALPAEVEVFHVEQLSVPGLNAERCIVWMRKHAS